MKWSLPVKSSTHLDFDNFFILYSLIEIRSFDFFTLVTLAPRKVEIYLFSFYEKREKLLLQGIFRALLHQKWLTAGSPVPIPCPQQTLLINLDIFFFNWTSTMAAESLLRKAPGRAGAQHVTWPGLSFSQMWRLRPRGAKLLAWAHAVTWRLSLNQNPHLLCSL